MGDPATCRSCVASGHYEGPHECRGCAAGPVSGYGQDDPGFPQSPGNGYGVVVDVRGPDGAVATLGCPFFLYARDHEEAAGFAAAMVAGDAQWAKRGLVPFGAEATRESDGTAKSFLFDAGPGPSAGKEGRAAPEAGCEGRAT